MRKVLLATALLAVPCAPSLGQQAASDGGARRFDVASVKRNYLPTFVQRPRIGATPGRFTATNVTLRRLAQYALDVPLDMQLTGGPRWINDTEFDVEATAPGASVEEIRPMLRRLLVERFGLAVRKEIRISPIYRLVRARDDDKLPKGLTPDACPPAVNQAQPVCNTIGGGPSSLMALSITMERFARLLAAFPYTEVDRVVVDATGLSGTYRLSMQFAATRQYEGLRSNPDPNLPTFMTALQEQVGLKLQPATGPVDVWIIESARMPDGN